MGLSHGGTERGRAPAASSVAMAVLWLEGVALLIAAPLLGAVPQAGTGGVLPVLLPVVLAALVPCAALLTVSHVLPAVALGHGWARRRGSARRGWRVAAVAVPALLLPVGVPLLVVVLYAPGDAPGSWPEARDWLTYAAVVYGVSLAASLAAHRSVLRADAGGRSPWPVGRVLSYGSLALCVEFAAVLAVLARA
ncbi:hypothetical protein [Streptomyces sp. NPDC054887]